MFRQEQTVAEEVATAIQGSGRRDAFFVDLFKVNQSTVSRLRAGKIRKAHKYKVMLVEHCLIHADDSSPMPINVKGLIEAANSHPELAEALIGLQKFVHKIMHA